MIRVGFKQDINQFFINYSVQFSSSVQFSCSVASYSATPRAAVCQASLSITNSSPLCQGCHPTILSSVDPFSSCLQYFQHQGLFQWVDSLPSGGQNIGVSASASVLPMNIQDWYPLGWTSWICLQFKGLSGVFSNTTVQKHQFFSAQLSL